MLLPFSRFGLLVLAVLLLPWLALLASGAYWLFVNDWLYQGIGILSADVMLAYALLHWRQRSAQPLAIEPIAIQPDDSWADSGLKAWQALEPLIEKWSKQQDVLTDPAKALNLTNEVLTVVARHFHADSQYPILEFPLPFLLKLIVLVCDDIQRDVLDKIPGSHAVTVRQLLGVKQSLDAIKSGVKFVQVGQWLFNWPGAALAKARGALFDKGLDAITQEIAQRLVKAYIGKLGYYAIQLYSGLISLDDSAPTSQLTPESDHDMSATQAREQTVEPLRILVLGQVSSGKSSLINALFGKIKTAAGWLPTTDKITPYVLEQDGLRQAIILDSAGYGGMLHDEAPAALQQEWAKVDVILVVCNAAQAARDADAEQLKAVRDYFLKQCRQQKLPVIIAVATHIDQLRPKQEWRPPYDIQNPAAGKGQNIRMACDAIAQDFAQVLEANDLKAVVPVCLAQDKPAYNIDDGLVPAIHEHLDEAQRVRYLRCLRRQQQQSYWRQWREQVKNLGQTLLKAY